jgi:hypothetical protein
MDTSTEEKWKYSSTLSLTSALDVGGERDSVTIVQEARWILQMVWTARKISLPTEFEPQTVQPVVSLYTDCAISAP